MDYDKLLALLYYEAEMLKETHPRVRMGVLCAIQITKEEKARKVINEFTELKEVKKEGGHYCPYCNQRFVLINDYYNHIEICDKKK